MIAKVGSFRTGAGTGSLTFDTGLGVKADCIYFLVGPPDTTGTLHDGIDCGMGWVDSHGNQYGAGLVLPWLADYRGQRQDWANAESTTQALFTADWPFPSAATTHFAGTVGTLHSDGTVDVNITTNLAGVARTIGFMALSGVDAIIGSFSWSSGTVTVNPWSPNKTPTFVSLLVRPSTGELGMAHAPGYGMADVVPHPGTPTSQRMASGNLAVWESQDGGGNARGVQAFITQDDVYSNESFGLGTAGGVIRPAFGSGPTLPLDVYTATIIANGFTITKTVNNVGSTLSSMHYMAVNVNDASILAEHVEPEPTPGWDAFTDISDLAVRAIMGAWASEVDFSGVFAPGLNVAGWCFADADGNQIALYASAVGGINAWDAGSGTADPLARPMLTSCGIFTDRVAEVAHGTYVDMVYDPGGSGPTENAKIVLDVASNPNRIVQTLTYDNIGNTPRLGMIVLGPVKTFRTQKGQIIRYL